jgi:hypothetical protein
VDADLFDEAVLFRQGFEFLLEVLALAADFRQHVVEHVHELEGYAAG